MLLQTQHGPNKKKVLEFWRPNRKRGSLQKLSKKHHLSLCFNILYPWIIAPLWKQAVQEQKDDLFHESKSKPSFFHVKKKFVKKKQLVKNNNAKKEESKKHSLFLLLYQFGTKLASSFYFSIGWFWWKIKNEVNRLMF